MYDGWGFAQKALCVDGLGSSGIDLKMFQAAELTYRGGMLLPGVATPYLGRREHDEGRGNVDGGGIASNTADDSFAAFPNVSATDS